MPARTFQPRLSSEQATRKDVERYKKHFPRECILVNRLDTTETGTFRRYLISSETEIPDTGVPVGFAVEGTQVLLLDENGRDVGFDQVGEIAVKSRFLPTGYWRKPELTREKFLPDPAGGQERLYLTGDLGRMGPDGRLWYLGRSDFQVKIRAGESRSERSRRRSSTIPPSRGPRWSTGTTRVAHGVSWRTSCPATHQGRPARRCAGFCGRDFRTT
jgi:acyl-CoA synthetase (AMP-forming)/AMP-acid ligase II